MKNKKIKYGKIQKIHNNSSADVVENRFLKTVF